MRVRDVVACLSIAFLSAACGDKDSPKKDGPSAKGHEEHKAPHGGEILELGEEAAHVEVVHDAKAATLTLYVYGKDMDTPVAVEPPTILLASKDGPRELKPTALDAKAGATASTSWRLADPALSSDPIEGRVRVTVAGTAYQSPLEPSGHGK